MRGVSRTLRLKGTGLKILWTVAIFGFFSISIITCVKTITIYYGYPTVTLYSEIFKMGKTEFPAVTICNLNPINEDTLANDKIMSADKFYSTVWNETEQINEEDRKFLRDRLIKIDGYFQNIEESEATRIGHQADTFLHTCTWHFLPKGTTSCSVTTFLSPKYFNCFTINLPTSHDSSNNEVLSRLTVVLYLNSIDTLKQLKFFDVHEDNSAGVQVKLLQPNEKTKQKQFAFTFSPGTAVRIPFSLVTRKMVPPPFSDCHEARNGEIYSRGECIVQCIQKWLAQECQCTDVDYTFALHPSTNSNNSYNQPEFCGKYIGMNISEVIQRLRCAEQRERIMSHVPACGCGPACTTVRYYATVSAAPWPRVKDHLAFYENHIVNKTYQHKFEIYNEIGSLMKINKTQAMVKLRDNAPLIQENFIKIEVDLSDLPHVHYIDQPKYSLVDLVAGLGGILNFYSGITVLFVIEIIEFLLVLIKHYYKSPATAPQNNVVSLR